MACGSHFPPMDKLLDDPNEKVKLNISGAGITMGKDGDTN